MANANLAACTYTGFDPNGYGTPGTGGTFSIPITTQAGCPWTSSTTTPWITVNQAGGTGSGNALYTTTPNNTGAARNGFVAIKGKNIPIASFSQCTFSFPFTPPGPVSVPAGGGAASVLLQTQAGCAWTASSTVPWAPLAAGNANGTGQSQVLFNFQANNTGAGQATIAFNILGNPSATSRTSTITIGGQTYSITQNGTQGGSITSGPLRFVALAPCRLMETRQEYNFEGRTGAFGPPFMRANENRTLIPQRSNVCQVPAAAKAYLLNVTHVPRGGVDFVTLYPAGEGRPNFWSVRSPDGQIVANSAIVKAGANGGFDVVHLQRYRHHHRYRRLLHG